MIDTVIGLPWKPNATGPHAFDCKGLVAHVLGRMGKPPPSLLVLPRDESLATARPLADVRACVATEGWRPTTEPPHEGDVLLCYGAGGAHVGVFVRYGTLGVLHSVQPPATPSGVRFDRLDDLLIGGAFGRASVWRYEG